MVGITGMAGMAGMEQHSLSQGIQTAVAVDATVLHGQQADADVQEQHGHQIDADAAVIKGR